MELPADVFAFLRELFGECNRRITEKLSANPNIPEESLDLTWIEHLSRYSAPIRLSSEWVVKIEVHYLGGLRHFRNWEIADIGVLLFVRRGGQVQTSKVALLQSKRLYPTTGTVIEEGITDYEVGFARLADPEDLQRSVATQAEYRFNVQCRYGALIVGSDQVKAIDHYERAQSQRVYYQFYNPWRLPFTQRVPLAGYPSDKPINRAGVRVVPANAVHEALRNMTPGYRPQVRDLPSATGRYRGGWPLESFVCDRFLRCLDGTVFESTADAAIQNLFYRRSGPIAAAVALTIEEPESAG